MAHDPKIFGLFSLNRFYRGRRATRLGRAFSLFWAAWSAVGLPSFGMAQLELIGRITGKRRRLAVVVTAVAGEDYLVSMLGECEWVRNARAHPDAAIVRGFRRRRIRLAELPVSRRAPIIQRFLQVAPGGRPHIGLGAAATLEECERVAPGHPVFAIVDPPRRLPSSGNAI